MALASLILGSQWTASEITLPAFLKRSFGEQVPIYSIVGINLWGCMLLPPIVGLLTSEHETFAVALPGMWLMAVSPLLLVLSPTPSAAAAWQVLLTLGEVLWAPRNAAWQATLAPTGREGIFLALASSRDLLMPALDVLMGYINARYNPKCGACEDRYGHFCSIATAGGAGAGTAAAGVVVGSATAAAAVGSCATQHGVCPPPDGGWMRASGRDLPLWGDSAAVVSAAATTTTTTFSSSSAAHAVVCPTTCHQCPGWSLPGGGRELWIVLLVFSLTGPLLAWAALPFLRDESAGRADGCWGVCSPRRCRCGPCPHPSQRGGGEQRQL